MLISAVLPIMSNYHNGSMHIVDMDVTSFGNSSPRLLDIVSVRKEGAVDSHGDFRVRRAVVLHALQCLVANNKKSIRINADALAMLLEDGDLSGLHSVTINCTNEDKAWSLQRIKTHT